MAHVRIEVDRGWGWTVRQQGEAYITADELAVMLPKYAIQHTHRAYRDGVLVGEI